MNEIVNNFTIELVRQINAMTLSDYVACFLVSWFWTLSVKVGFSIVEVMQDRIIKAQQDLDNNTLNNISREMFCAAQHAMILTFPKGRLYDSHPTSLWIAYQFKRATYE